MKLEFRNIVTLIACLSLFALQPASAQRQREYQTASNAAEMAEALLTSFNSYDTFEACGSEDCDSGYCGCSSADDCSCDSGGYCDCDSCSGGGSGLGCGLLSQPGQFYVGADYLYVRSTFSEATAFVAQTQVVAPPAVPFVTNVFTQLEYDYQSSYRIFGGYRLCECGGDIQFGFTRYDSDATASAVQGVDGDVIVSIPEEVITNVTGDRIDVDSGVRAQSFDLAFSKTIPLGGGCSCECPDTCCGNSCGCGCCPAWDITWSGGIRFSEVDWNRNYAQFDVANNQGNTSSTVMDFEGGGPRWGLEGRRYLGNKYRFDLFLKGDISLLLGDIGITNTQVVAGIPNTTRLSTTQIVPVLDIVAGGTAYLSDRLTVSGGYLFSAWHDLGMRDTFDIMDDPGFINPTYLTFDDANILGFDGFFVRTEFAF